MGIIRTLNRTLVFATLFATLLLVLPVFVVGAIQTTTNVTTYPATYTNQTNTYFNFTWGLNGTTNLNVTVVELNYTGTPTNYTLTNVTCLELNCTWSYAIIHQAGSYYFRGFAIDNYSEQSTVGPGYYTIAKATIPASTRFLSLANATHTVQGDITIKEDTSLNVTGSFNLTYEPYTVTLAVDGVSIGTVSGAAADLYVNQTNITTFDTPGRFNVSTSLSTMNYTGYLSYFVHVQDTTAPVYVSNVSVTPGTFSAAAQANFTVNWTDWNLTGMLVYITVNRSDGAGGYVMTTYAMSNTTSERTAWNFTQSDFPAGTHYWRANATDVYGNVNDAMAWSSFTITKAAPTLAVNLSGTPNADHFMLEDASIWLNGSVTVGDSGATIRLFLDSTAKGVETGGTIANYTLFDTPGTYTVRFNYTTTQNYSDSVVSYAVHVNDTTPPAHSAEVAVTPGTFSASAQANFTVNWTDWNLTGMLVYITVNRSGVLTTYAMSNATSDLAVWNFTQSDFPAGTHYWRANATDVYGNLNDTMAWSPFTITKAAPTTVLWLGDVAGDNTIDPLEVVWLNGSLTTGDSDYTLNLYIDGVLLGTNASGRVENQTSFASTAVRNISLNYTSTQNYSASTLSYFLTVSDTTAPVYVSNVSATPVTFSAAAQANFTVNWTDWNLTGMLVYITVNRSGVLTTYAMSNTTDERTAWNFSLSGLPAGTHYWRANATDVYGNLNDAMAWSAFIVAQIAPTLSANLGGTADANHFMLEDASIWLNGTVTTGDSSATLRLFLDSTAKGVETGAAIANYTLFDTPGTYTFLFNYTSTQNYTDFVVSYTVNVNDTTAPAYVSNVSVTPGTFSAAAQANFTVNWTDWNLTGMLVYITVNRSGVLTTYAMSNTTSERTAWNFTQSDFPAGTHYWRANATDVYGNLNDAMAWFPFTITKAAPTLAVNLSGTPNADHFMLEDASIWLNGSVTVGDSGATIRLFLDSTAKGVETGGTIANYTLFDTPGTYTVRFNYTTTQNYSDSVVSYTVNVNDTTAPSYVSNVSVIPGTFSAAAQANFTVNWTDWNVSGMLVYITMNISGVNTTYAMSNTTSERTAWNFTLSGLPAGTHYWRANATDVYGNVNDAMAWMSFTVGKIAPTLNLSLNGTEGNITIGESSLVVINGSLTTGDSGTGMELRVNNSLYANLTLVGNATSFGDRGSFRVDLIYPETQNYSSSNISLVITVQDQTVPVISGAAYTATYTSATFTWTTDDASTGIATVGTQSTEVATYATSQSVEVTGLTSGIYNAVLSSCNEDNYCTEEIFQDIIVPVQPSSGGGGGAAAPPQPSTTVVITIEADTPKVVDVNDNVGVLQLQIETTTDLPSVEVKVEKLADLPATVADTSGGAVYHYLQVSTKRLASTDIKNVKFDFKVEKSWLAGKGAAENSVVLLRYVNGKWVELSTRSTGSDSAYVYYSADSPGFSVFAIATRVVAAPPTTLPEQPPAEPPVEPPVEEPPVEEPPVITPPEEQPAEKGVSGGVLLTAVLVIVLAGALGWYAYTKKK